MFCCSFVQKSNYIGPSVVSWISRVFFCFCLFFLFLGLDTARENNTSSTAFLSVHICLSESHPTETKKRCQNKHYVVDESKSWWLNQDRWGNFGVQNWVKVEGPTSCQVHQDQSQGDHEFGMSGRDGLRGRKNHQETSEKRQKYVKTIKYVDIW